MYGSDDFQPNPRWKEAEITKSDVEVTLEFLQTFADAWNRHDLDALMKCMAGDCVYETSSGDDVRGTRYAGMH